MDDKSVLKITHDGRPFVEGKPPEPRSFTVSMVNDAPSTNIVTQEQVLRLRNERTAKQGRFAWTKLHEYRGCDPQWLDLWKHFIPNQCDCQEGFQKIIEQHPPDFSSPDAFFCWGVEVHDLVNEKRGVATLGIAMARLAWDRPEPKNQGFQ